MTSRLEVRYHEMKGKHMSQQTIRHYIYYLMTRVVVRPMYSALGTYLGGNTGIDSPEELKIAAIVVAVASGLFIVFNLLYFDEFKVILSDCSTRNR